MATYALRIASALIDSYKKAGISASSSLVPSELDGALVQHQHGLVHLAVHYVQGNRRRERRKRREIWLKPWTGRRRQFGLCDWSLVRNSLLMEPDSFDALIQRVGDRIAKQHTRYRAPGACTEACIDCVSLSLGALVQPVWMECSP